VLFCQRHSLVIWSRSRAGAIFSDPRLQWFAIIIFIDDFVSEFGPGQIIGGRVPSCRSHWSA